MKHAYWSDVVTLIKETTTKDEQNYETIVEEPRTVMCSWQDGVSQSEFYNSMKAGLQADAEVLLWAVDYNREKLVEFNGVRYNVIRVTTPQHDQRSLILSEVVR